MDLHSGSISTTRGMTAAGQGTRFAQDTACCWAEKSKMGLGAWQGVLGAAAAQTGGVCVPHTPPREMDMVRGVAGRARGSAAAETRCEEPE